MNYSEESLKLHYKWHGKLETVPKMSVSSREDLSLTYTPGVAQACIEIKNDLSKSYELTGRGNTIAVITDGTAVLGLGDIGPEAAMPVMEGKCVLFKSFANVDAVPLCINTKDVDSFVNAAALLEKSFGGINLEDISAPRCFEIKRKLQERCSIPVFHDDQHGTAVVVAAALINALRVVGKDISKIKAVISGAGAAGTAIFKLLYSLGLRNAIICDIHGILYEGRPDLEASEEWKWLASHTNAGKQTGTLADAMKGADLFIGVSAPGIVTKEMVQSMAERAIVFPMANPVPEIMPDLALQAGAAVVGTGRSDFPNQINNVLAFPGIFRGALDARVGRITDDMMAAAVYALADRVPENELNAEHILPDSFDKTAHEAVAKAVAEAAVKSR